MRRETGSTHYQSSYNYADCNPITFNDPTGMQSEDTGCAEAEEQNNVEGGGGEYLFDVDTQELTKVAAWEEKIHQINFVKKGEDGGYIALGTSFVEGEEAYIAAARGNSGGVSWFATPVDLWEGIPTSYNERTGYQYTFEDLKTRYSIKESARNSSTGSNPLWTAIQWNESHGAAAKISDKSSGPSGNGDTQWIGEFNYLMGKICWAIQMQLSLITMFAGGPRPVGYRPTGPFPVSTTTVTGGRPIWTSTSTPVPVFSAPTSTAVPVFSGTTSTAAATFSTSTSTAATISCVTTGFRSFSAFKRTFGSAGPGQAWHHIVEQTPGNVANFGPHAVHNTGNLIKLPHGPGTIHDLISRHYNSIQPFTDGLRVRQWLSTQSYQAQYNYGIKMLKQFGWTP